ncbi:MAG: site-2 protease family protein, partial [Candidatus Micrarchaeia archaeon]
VAMKFGGYAEFKMWAQGLILALVLATFLGVVFAAPGAVYIYAPRITRKQNGLISLAGPLVNLILSVIFLALALLIPLSFGSMNIWYFASKINVWLGMFNMVPVYPLDGSKILDWNIFVWGAFAAMFALLFII